jgi:hypothetical protein
MFSAMNALLDKAISAIKKLPEAEQEAIAREVLDRIAADARWDALFADPRSEALLERLADAALKFRVEILSKAIPATGVSLEVPDDAHLLALIR